MEKANRHSAVWTILLAAAATLLGMQALRVFATNLVWYLGETSDRVVMAVVAFVAFGTVGLAWPLLRLAGHQRAALISAAGLVLVRLIDQANPVAVLDLTLGFLGVLFFGWLVVARIGRDGRAAGIGLAAALGLDIAIRAAFDTVDVAFSESVWATLIVIALAALLLAAVWRGPGPAAGRVGAAAAWQLLGIPAALLLFMLVTGNFGQVAVRGQLGWGETVIWLSAGAAAGLIRTLLPRDGDRSRRLAHTLISAAALAGGLLAYWGGSGGIWVAVAALGLAHLLCLLPADPSGDAGDGGGPSTLFVTLGFILFVALLFIFYSFYGPFWVVIVLIALVVLGGFGAVVRTAADHRPALGASGRWLVIGLVLLSLAPGLVKALTHGTPAVGDVPAGVPTRVLSYNIRQGFGLEDRFGLEPVAAEIERHNPDVVALQEIARGWVISGMVDQLQWLANRLDMRLYFEPNLADTWGNAFLVRLPVLAEEHRRFEDLGRVPRGVQGITVATANGPLRILITHLDSEADGDRVRADQAGEVLGFWGGGGATLLVGDMNFVPDSAGYALVAASGLRDLLRETGNDGPTYPANAPFERIDYAFGTADLAVSIAESPVSTASDHRPVLIDLEVR
jgi:endonuclease/exonuclease/phosphatase family metal-dependent hydrolase